MILQIKNMNKTWTKYLLWFAQEHINFRFQEIESLASMFNIKMRFVEEPTHEQPFWIVEFCTEEDAKILTRRSVSIRSCLELWSYANDIDTLHGNLKRYPLNLMEPFLGKSSTFKIEIETFCKHFTQKEKLEKIESFAYIPFKGDVKLKDPDICFQYIEYYGTDPRNPPEDPYNVFFGRWIANGLRQLIKQLSLKTRKFIGNTSMDPQLSLLMANQAQVKNGDLVLDPFVGSGSLLVAAAQFGAYVLGTDIDYLMLHARTRPSRISQKVRQKDESIKANMTQYNLQHRYLDVLVNDFSMPIWKDNFQVDAIITDPPYGIREAMEKIGTSKENYVVKEEHLPTHIPAKIEYGLSSIYNDLLAFTVKHLKIGGRLVTWFPVFRQDYNDKGLPSHQHLKLVGNSEQILSKYTSRRLLTYEKCDNVNNIDVSDNEIQDFRTKYFEIREETRKDRRMRNAAIRLQGRLEAERRKHKEESDNDTKTNDT